jgi:DsbC/DsbD-like thiol-disulfide interchange protein
LIVAEDGVAPRHVSVGGLQLVLNDGWKTYWRW